MDFESARLAENVLPFSPPVWARQADIQTLAGHFLPGPKSLPGAKRHFIALPDGDRLALCENLPADPQRATGIALLMHGLGGHASSPYMLRIGGRFLRRGWLVYRLNHRGAGAGKGLARNIYHSGRSEDLSPVLQHIAAAHPALPLVMIGFSLSGNILLKFLGEGPALRPALAVAVNPPIELARSALEFRRRRNRLYDLRFVRLLRQAIAERQAAFPDFPRFHLSPGMTLTAFDEQVTAPLGGFPSAAAYYQRCSARPLLGSIRVPTVIITSDDDPFIPAASFAGLPQNDHLMLIITHGGGHMGYISQHKTPLGDRRWLDYTLLALAERVSAGIAPPPQRRRKSLAGA